jgi:lysophospholipase L1-like esterase
MIHLNHWVIIGTIIAVVVAFVALNVMITGLQALAAVGYWQTQMREPVAPNAIRLVALGDSSVEGIGASSATDSYVGRIATYAHEKTGRPVHIANVATGGPITDIVSRQLPKVDLKTADIVIVADDNLRGMSLAQYRATLDAIAAAVPAHRTVISDLPGLPGEDRYQPVLTEVANEHGIMRADVKAIFNGDGRRLDIFSWLPPHLNSKGYGYWFQAFKPKVDVVLEHPNGR